MSFNVYMLSLLMSINGTAQFLAAVSTALLVLMLMAKHQGEKTPRQWPVWAVFVVSVLVATLVPSRNQIIAAVAVEQGPAFAKDLIDSLRSK